MTSERIEDFREIVLPFLSGTLLRTNYENMGKSDYGSIMVSYAITKDTKTDKGIEKLVSDVLKQAKEQVLQIIDKHISGEYKE